MRKNLKTRFLSLALGLCLFAESALSSGITAFANPVIPNATTQQEDILYISDATFPDKNFRKFVSENVDLNQDTILSEDEIENITELDISNLGISDLEGIKLFKNLEILDCSLNRLSSIDLSDLTKLSNLNCTWNNISKINLKNCSSLENTDFSKNASIINNMLVSPQIETDSSIDVLNLETIDPAESIEEPALAKEVIDVEISTDASISVDSVTLTSSSCENVFIDEKTFPDANLRNYILSTIDLNENQILDAQEIDNISYLYLDKLEIEDLTGIELFKNLVYLSANENNIKSINIENFPFLLEVYLNNNSLLGIDANANTHLEVLECEENTTTLQLSNNTLDLSSINTSQISNLSIGTLTNEGIIEFTEEELSQLADNAAINYTYNTYAANESSSSVNFSISVEPASISTREIEEFCTVTFDTKGGSSIAPITIEAATQITPPDNPTRLGYKLKTKRGIAVWYNEYGDAWDFDEPVTESMTLYCKWSKIKYEITYNLDNGELKYSYDNLQSTYTVTSDTFDLPELVRSGYIFDGWYTDANFTQKITQIAEGSTGDLTLFAKWIKVELPAPVINSFKYTKKGTAKLTFNSDTKPEGYEIIFSTNKNFKSNCNVVKTKSTSYTITNALKKTYYIKVRSYGVDSYGKTVYGPYSEVKSLKIKNGVKEYAAKSNSAKIKKCDLTSADTIAIKAKISKRIKSSDSSYYLVKVEPSTNKVVGKPVAVSPKLSTVTYEIANGNDNAALMAKYAIAIKKGSKYKLISSASYINSPSKAADYTGAFPVAASKKGLQGSSDSEELGVKHTLVNIDLVDVISPDNSGTPFEYNGKTYYFNKQYTGFVSECNRKGITVSAVILLSYRSDLKYLIHPKARKYGAAPYYTLNTTQKKARETLEAAFQFLTSTLGTEDCHVSNWILGNEVNIHTLWNYSGGMSLSQLTKEYARAFRILYYAAESNWSNARCYISLDHSWTDADNGYGGKEFLSAFNSAIKKENKKIAWNIAYHAYPVPLTEPAFWNNGYTSNNADSNYITLKNLNVLTNYVKKKYGSKTRIILSEQGFTSTAGQNIQAAALAYGYYLAEFNPMIDSFIIRSDRDNDVEISQGLAMGLKTIDGKTKKAYTVFKYMDTPDSTKYTNFALKVIGKKSWKSIVPKYNKNKFKSMPSIK